MPWEGEAFLAWSRNQGELARPANLSAGGALLGRCSRQGKRASPRGRITGPGGRSSSLGFLAGNQDPGREGIVSVPQRWEQNSASQKLVEPEPDPLGKSRSQPPDRLSRPSLLPPAGPSFLPSGLHESQSLCTSFFLLRKGRGLLAPSHSGVPVRRPAPKPVGTWEERGHRVGPLAQDFAPPRWGKGSS